MRVTRMLCALFALGLAHNATAGFAVVSSDPAPRALTTPTDTSITIEFDREIDPLTVTESSLWAFGRWSGLAEGEFVFDQGMTAVSLVPDRPFSAGESVMVILSHDLRGDDGEPLRTEGYSFQFWTASAPASLEFESIDVLTTNLPAGASSRPYGGIGTDLNNDGCLDITIVNEDTADLRTFLNRADGTGFYEPFLDPPFAVNDRASPSEPADFNRDGNADICVANINTDTVSVLLGNGDGTFGPQQEIDVGDAPRGIAVLDADGDGDVDIVCTNSGQGGSLSLLVNDGDGVFAAQPSFDAGVNGEWALAAADMTEDGLLDLVVAARNGEQMVVVQSDGDGTFTPLTPVASGAIWMLVCGDVNGDGHEDVAAVDGTDDFAVLHLGDGAGNLGPASTISVDDFPLATDLADLDGDGDLDWITSSFGGDWTIFRNGGAGDFTFDQEIPAPSNASCCVPLDFDEDGDLDLALIDEIDDTVTLMRNTSNPRAALTLR
jgi:hypothetical protein